MRLDLMNRGKGCDMKGKLRWMGKWAAVLVGFWNSGLDEEVVYKAWEIRLRRLAALL